MEIHSISSITDAMTNAMGKQGELEYSVAKAGNAILNQETTLNSVISDYGHKLSDELKISDYIEAATVPLTIALTVAPGVGLAVATTALAETSVGSVTAIAARFVSNGAEAVGYAASALVSGAHGYFTIVEAGSKKVTTTADAEASTVFGTIHTNTGALNQVNKTSQKEAKATNQMIENALTTSTSFRV